MNRALTAAVLAAAVPVTTLLAACSGSSHSPSNVASSAGSAGGAAPVVAARWWSNAAGPVGQKVGTSTTAPKSLQPSRTVYCTMLRQTVAAGRSVLPGATATSPALATTTQAFVTELEAVAPPAVASSWHVLGPVLVDVVKSGGALANLRSHVDASAVSAAAQAISADAQAGCHLELAR